MRFDHADLGLVDVFDHLQCLHVVVNWKDELEASAVDHRVLNTRTERFHFQIKLSMRLLANGRKFLAPYMMSTVTPRVSVQEDAEENLEVTDPLCSMGKVRPFGGVNYRVQPNRDFTGWTY